MSFFSSIIKISGSKTALLLKSNVLFYELWVIMNKITEVEKCEKCNSKLSQNRFVKTDVFQIYVLNLLY